MEFAYNYSYHSSLGVIPYEVLCGPEVYIPYPLCPHRKMLFGFAKKKKLSPHYIGLFEVLERIVEVAYRLALPPSLAKVHKVFHVSILRRYVHSPSHVIDNEPLHVHDDLTYDEQPVEILDMMEKVLHNKTILLVKVLWHNHAVEEATWELDEEMRKMYPHLYN
ncbi:uncharacterized protein LOC131317514 [Rhododendron vialii]|uniref:uncharacterized protein LOC131317514 n=1 Tax=Rhododendron vialii TaxID=182163 RepID=UPI00265E7F89|nr:uncharacterized protein LOC131317514 [Rhododendron vialii]